MSNMFMKSLRAAITDRRGMEALEYATFAAAFLVLIAATVSGILGDIQSAYDAIGAYILAHAGSL